jgi:hypothetical protein
MGLIIRNKRCTIAELKDKIASIEAAKEKIEREIKMMQTNIVGEETRAEDIMRHELALAAFGRKNISEYQRYDEMIAYVGNWLQDRLREKFSFTIDVFSAYDACYIRWVIKADTPYSTVSQDFTKETLDAIDMNKTFEYFVESIEKSIPSRFKRKVEVSLPVQNMRLFRCECCNAVLTSTTCEYCGAKYFIN